MTVSHDYICMPLHACMRLDEYQEELSKIGKLAFDALLEDCLHFNFSKFPKGDLFEKLIHVGFFQVSKLSALNREKIVYFLHKSVQEFLAAWFIVQEVKVKKNETVTCLSGMDTFEKSRKMDEVLKFVCESSSDAASFVFDHLRYVGEKEGLTIYNFTRTPSVNDLSDEQCDFIELCVDCLFCCPASDRLTVYSTFLSCVNHVVLLHDEHVSTAAEKNFFKGTASFPNYLFFKFITKYDDRESILSILSDLNAVVLTSSGEIEDVKKYADLRLADFFLKKSEKRNFIYLGCITNDVFHSKLLSELISAPVCPSQPPVDNLGKNEDNNIALSLTENRSDQTQQHCVSLVREVNLLVETVEDFVLLKNMLPLVTAPRNIDIWRNKTYALEGISIESAIYGINFTDNLHRLELCKINLTGKCVAFIAESLHHSPNLHELCLSGNPLHSGVSHLAENLHHVPQLTELKLIHVQMGEKECAALASSLQYLNKLKRLIISVNALGHGIIELAKNLNSVPNLTWLKLSDTNIGEDEASALACALKDVPELSILSLGSNPLGRGVMDLVQHLCSVPKPKEDLSPCLDGVQMTKLTDLELRDVQMGEKECAALAASLQYLKKLKKLDMSNNVLGHGIIELAKNLNSVPTLNILDLENTNMGEDEASALARALKDAPELRILILGSNPLGRGVRELVQHLSSVPKLIFLNLDGVPMTKTELKMLFSALTGREITLYTDYHVSVSFLFHLDVSNFYFGSLQITLVIVSSKLLWRQFIGVVCMGKNVDIRNSHCFRHLLFLCCDNRSHCWGWRRP